MDVTKDQVIEAMSFIWVTYRSKNDSQTAESPKPTLVWVISQKKLGSQSTQCSLQAAQEVESMFSRDRPNPPQSNLIVFCLSQSDGLVAASSLQLGLFIFWKKGSNDFVQFQRLLEALLGCLPSNLRTMPSVWACFYLGETQQDRAGEDLEAILVCGSLHVNLGSLKSPLKSSFEQTDILTILIFRVFFAEIFWISLFFPLKYYIEKKAVL